jgi:hypothetical protein
MWRCNICFWNLKHKNWPELHLKIQFVQHNKHTMQTETFMMYCTAIIYCHKIQYHGTLVNWILFKPKVKYCLICVNFHEGHAHSTALIHSSKIFSLKSKYILHSQAFYTLKNILLYTCQVIRCHVSFHTIKFWADNACHKPLTFWHRSFTFKFSTPCM